MAMKLNPLGANLLVQLGIHLMGKLGSLRYCHMRQDSTVVRDWKTP